MKSITQLKEIHYPNMLNAGKVKVHDSVQKMIEMLFVHFSENRDSVLVNSWRKLIMVDLECRQSDSTFCHPKVLSQGGRAEAGTDL